jgi:hypothetical protein
MAHDRGFFPNYLLYVSAIGMALMGITLGLTGAATIIFALGPAAVTSNPEIGLSQRERTLLDIRMDDLREIRQAVAKPLPSPEPLPRLTVRATAQSTHPLRNSTSSKMVSLQSNRRKLMVEARKVLEKIEPFAPDAQLSAYAESDRHAVH